MPALVFLIALVAWLYFVSLDMLATGLPLALEAAGAGETWIGFLAGWMGLAALVQRPLLAAWGDRRGHWPVLLASLLAAVAGSLLFAASSAPGLQLVARTLQGTSLAGLVVASQALMVALVPAGLRGRALALQGLADTGGVLAGTNLGEWTWRREGTPGLFLLAAALAAAALLLALAGRAAAAAGRRTMPRAARRPRPAAAAGAPGGDPAGPARGPAAGHPAHRSPTTAAAAATAPAARGTGKTAGPRWPVTVPVLLMGGAIGVVFGAVLNLTVLHAQRVGYHAGTWLAVFALVSMLARYGAGFFIDRHGERGPDRLLPPAFAAMAAGAAAMATAASPAIAYGAAGVLALGYGAGHTALVTRVVARAPEEQRGAAAGWVANSIDLGLGVGLAVLGWILETFSFPVMYATLAATAGTGAVLATVSSTTPGLRPGTPRNG